MEKSISSFENQFVRQKIISLRKAAGITQRDLAERMQREQSFIWRLETGERRLDMIEFLWICRALGADASKAYAEILQEISANSANGDNRLVAEPSPKYPG